MVQPASGFRFHFSEPRTTMNSRVFALSPLLLVMAGASAQSNEPTQLQTVTVTGEKIARELKNTTTSVGVIDAERLDQSGVRSLPDALRLLANVRDADFLDSGFLIRGINSEGVGGPAGRPLASIVIDGVTQTDQGARRGALGLWDVEQVELLRGPQSTVSGRNALAGSLRLQTKDPIFKFDAAGQLRAGNQEQRGAALMLNVLLAETLALRLSGEYSHARGFVDYPDYAGLPRLAEREDDDYRQARAKLLWKPKGLGGLTVLLSHANAYDSPSYDDVDGPSAGVDWFDRRWGAQSAPVFVEARYSRNASTALEATLPLGRQWKLTSLSTQVQSKTGRPSVDEASLGLITQTERAQELRVNFDSASLRAVGGLYLNRERFQDDRDQIRPWQPTVLRADRRSGEVDNDAVFGEVNWTVGALTWIAGLRHDRESQHNRSLSQRITLPAGTVATSSEDSTKATFSATLPKLGVTWALNNEHTLGLVAQQGYRAGGAAVNAVTGQTYSYQPEKANNLELSWRWQSTDQRWRVNVNLFDMQWKQQQVNVPQIPGDFTSDLIVNAGRSRVRGGELELQARPSATLDLFASLGVADTRFTDFSFVQFGAPLDLSGQAFPQAPKTQLALGGQWRVGGGWFIGGDVKHTSKALSRSVFEGLPADQLPAYTVLNLRAGLQCRRLRVSLYADNASDEKYFLYRYDDPSFQVATVGKGRTFGVTLDAQF
jgi:outer membrane receptor protein involved in Fe transport